MGPSGSLPSRSEALAGGWDSWVIASPPSRLSGIGGTIPGSSCGGGEGVQGGRVAYTRPPGKGVPSVALLHGWQFRMEGPQASRGYTDVTRFSWFNPMRWARSLVFVALLALDFKHIYSFVLELTTHDHAPVVLIGQLLPGVTNGQFDALTYAAMVPATIYFVSNTLARRLAREQSAGMFWTALVVGTALSALANAGTMFAAATGWSLVWGALAGPASALIGGMVTLGLLMFASMDSWDAKGRVLKGGNTRRKRAAEGQVRTRRTKSPNCGRNACRGGGAWGTA